MHGHNQDENKREQPSISLKLNELADYLSGFVVKKNGMPALRDLKPHELTKLIETLEDLSLEPLNKVLNAVIEDVKSTGRGNHPENKNESVFAKYHQSSAPSKVDKSIFDPGKDFSEVIKNAYRLEAIGGDGYAGMSRGQADLEATQSYTTSVTQKAVRDNEINLDVMINGHKRKLLPQDAYMKAVLEKKIVGDPIINLIELRAKQQAVYGAVQTLLSNLRAMKNPDPNVRERAYMVAASQLQNSAVPLREAANLINACYRDLVEERNITRPIIKPDIMSVSDFRKSTSLNVLAIRPNILKEIDNQLRVCLGERQIPWSFFRRRQTVSNPLGKYQDLEKKLGDAISNELLDSRRKDGLRKLLAQVKDQIEYLEDKTVSSKAIYAATSAIQSFKNEYEVKEGKPALRPGK